ncbi:hypothetical protein [Caudoviricetes sp.]|nr:hypothetical protein [Caudoviricetes sp.]
MPKHEQDLLYVKNPTKESFTVIWGGYEYTVDSEETKIYPRFVAEHFAKHLADKVLLQNEAAIKADSGKIVNLLNNAIERPAVVNSILIGVYSEFRGDGKVDPNVQTAQLVEQLNQQQPEKEEKALDVGAAVDDKALGVLKEEPKPTEQNHTLEEAVAPTPEDTPIADKPKSKPKRTRAQLIEEAQTLGIDVKGTETVEQLEVAIKAF